MARRVLEKNTFSTGELAPELWGRSDLSAYANGAARLRNVFIEPSGGVRRRPGIRLIDELPEPARLIQFEFNTEQTYLLGFGEKRALVFEDGVETIWFETTFGVEHHDLLNWTQSADTLLVVHPDAKPVRITRTGDGTWQTSLWAWRETNLRTSQPYYKFGDPAATLTPSGTSGTVTVTASMDVFVPGHVGTLWRIQGIEGEIKSVANGRSATIALKQALPNANATVDFVEQAFSDVRGWPRSVTFHQDRMIIGGSRDLPNRLWMSKSGDLFNFELGEGLDDEAIEFALLADQVNAITGIFAGRHLQVFTSGSEWMVTGDPLTPANVQVTRQTRIGSQSDRTVPLVNVDGATLFAGRSGREIREFLFADAEQAYGSADLALLSRHLIHHPIDQAFDPDRRLLHVVMRDGSLATLTLYRSEAITAWSAQSVAGCAFRSISVSGGDVYVVLERDGRYFLGVFDPACGFDLYRRQAVAEGEAPRRHWGNLDALDGLDVSVWHDGVLADDIRVAGGTITLPESIGAVPEIEVGLPFTHEIYALPPAASDGSRPHGGNAVRLVSVTLRLQETGQLRVDTGRGLRDVALPVSADDKDALYSGDITLRALGWRRGSGGTVKSGLWRIAGDLPRPFLLLGAASEMGVND
ncbi:hypothetical protein [Thalassospira indica]|uniref:Phage protein n=1 Tax=Thalassospira indica TaxID=1891279 RepID=A0ABN5NIG7_9PROT|nr:hypothetical protein [Thalassospira indica]AXO15660.1 hypothetical protein DY252_16590 [Thalassospira indica]OAZ14063.1 hypothetical protein TH15_07460 [Thalassospira profundimaris]